MGIRTICIQLIVIITLVSVGCKSRKKVEETVAPVIDPVVIGGSNGPSSPDDSLYKAILDGDAKLGWFGAKVSAGYEIDKDSRSFTANLRIRKDSAIWMSISPALGIEVARVMITKDSLKFLNRIDGKYFKGNYSYLNELLQIDVNFQMVQSILLGNSYLHHAVENYIAIRENQELIFSTLKKRKMRRETELEIPEILSQEIWFSPASKKITRMEMKDYRPVREFIVNYNGFEEVDQMVVPNSLEIKANAKKQVKIRLDYSKININKTLNFPFTIPENYEPMH